MIGAKVGISSWNRKRYRSSQILGQVESRVVDEWKELRPASELRDFLLVLNLAL